MVEETAGGTIGRVDGTEESCREEVGSRISISVRLSSPLALEGQGQGQGRAWEEEDRKDRRTPRFGKEFSDGRGLEFGEEGTTVNRTEVADIAHPVQFLGNDCETGRLLKIEAGRGDEVTGREEVRHFRTDVVVRPAEHFLDIPLCDNPELSAGRIVSVRGNVLSKKSTAGFELRTSRAMPSRKLFSASSRRPLMIMP